MHHTHNRTKQERLTRSQRVLLLVLYKFRFTTTDIVAAVLHKDRSTLYERFTLLVKKGYILKRYNSSYRLAQKAARYSLSTQGVAYLRKHTQLPESNLRRHYGNKTAEETLVDRHIEMAERYLRVQQTLPQHELFTGYELTKDDSIRPFPHIYAQPKRQSGTHYFLDYFPPFTASWMLRKRLVQHQDADNDVDYTYPHVLLVAGNTSTEQRLLRLTESSMQDFCWYITTSNRLKQHPTNPIWIDVAESTVDDIYHSALS